MPSRSSSGFSVIPLMLLLAGSGLAWLWMYDRVMDMARAFTG